jgi:predicted GIY-YIG superfamily endonuclease
MDIAKYPEMDMDKVERGDSGQINIYCIVHRENNRVYRGQTRDLKKRIGEHQ